MEENDNSKSQREENFDFSSKNDVERFLATSRFRKCGNLGYSTLRLEHQTVHMPFCQEGRFHKEGVANSFDLPDKMMKRLSPIVCTTIPIWAPLVSCPHDCKGYRNRSVAKFQRAVSSAVRWLFKKKSIKAGEVEKPWWKEWTTLIVTGVIVGIILLLLTPYFTKSTTPKEQPAQSQPESKPTQPSTDDVKPIAPAKPPSRNVGSVVTNPVQVKPPATQDCPDNKGICIAGDNNGQAMVYQNTPEAVLEWEHFEDPNQAQGAKHPIKVVRAWVNHAWEDARFAVFCDRPCTALHIGFGGVAETATGAISGHKDIAVFIVCVPNPFPPTMRAEMSVESADDDPINVVRVARLKAPDDKTCSH